MELCINCKHCVDSRYERLSKEPCKSCAEESWKNKDGIKPNFELKENWKKIL